MASREEIVSENDAIKGVLRAFPTGANLEQIRRIARLKMGVRSLQRRLKALKNEGEIASIGSTRSIRYKLADDVYKQLTTRDIRRTFGVDTLSPEALKTYMLLQEPDSGTYGLSYNRAFLDSYQPNVDFYLTSEERRRLHLLGQTMVAGSPAGTHAKKVLQRLLIDLSWNSSRLEGNTYTLLETQRLLELGELADSKSVVEGQMILNHKAAIEALVIHSEEIGFSRYFISTLHALLSDELLETQSLCGHIRSIPVHIVGTSYAPPSIPQLIEELFELILQKAEAILDPFEQSFFLMVHLPYLQPFQDVNKRLSRMAANIPFIRANLSPISFVDVPVDLYIKGILGVYEENRVDLLKEVFIWAYERSAVRYADLCAQIGPPNPFRFKYQFKIKAAVAFVILNALSKKEAIEAISEAAKSIPAKDYDRFVESVETDLLDMHDTMIAIYGVRLSEFHEWKKKWDQ